MVHLFEFQYTPNTAKIKPIEEFAKNPDGVPKNWGGFVALFEPNKSPKKSKFWTAYWFASKNSKTIKKAKLVVER